MALFTYVTQWKDLVLKFDLICISLERRYLYADGAKQKSFKEAYNYLCYLVANHISYVTIHELIKFPTIFCYVSYS